MDSFLTLAKEGRGELVERRSRFIGFAAPLQSEEQVQDVLSRIEKKEWGARHRVYAFILRSGVSRCSDGGEPQGTGGVPLLEVLKKNRLSDCAVVVTRYFGGVLLGTGGLARAYGAAASLAVRDAGVVRQVRCVQAELCCPYSAYGRAQQLILSFGGAAETSDYGEKIVTRFHIPQDDFQGLQSALTDATAGQAEITVRGHGYFPI